jgi:thiamine-monophosphate kinase
MARRLALTEQAFIEFIARRAHPVKPRPIIGIGDDAAVLNPPPRRQTILTTDMLTDGVHFRTERTPGVLVGRKALAVNLSDVAAMGGVPHSCVVSVGFPRGTPASYAREVARGLTGLARSSGVALVGGDTCAARALFVNVTLVGLVEPGRAVTRAGARPGEHLYVTGTLGASAAGLELLGSRRRRSGAPRVRSRGRSVTSARRLAIRAHLDPTPRIAAGRALGLAGLATAMIDLSDGLTQDLPRLCRASGTGAVVLQAALPIAPAAGTLFGPDGAMRLALCGGEDYELLFTARPECEPLIAALSRRLRLPISRIGQMLPRRQGIRTVDAAGRYRPLPPGGFEHFRR